MGLTLKIDDDGTQAGQPAVRDAMGLSTPELASRQAAASYLQASTLARDPATRASLRRHAAALLSPALDGAGHCLAC